MIITSMLKRQVWMADDDEFDHIVKNCWRMKKMSWWGNIESHLYLQAIIVLHQPTILKDTWKTQFLSFIKPRRTIQSWPLQICLETLSIPIHLKMEMEEFVT